MSWLYRNSSLSRSTASFNQINEISFKNNFSVNTRDLWFSKKVSSLGLFYTRDGICSGAEGIVKNALHADLVVVGKEL